MKQALIILVLVFTLLMIWRGYYKYFVVEEVTSSVQMSSPLPPLPKDEPKTEKKYTFEDAVGSISKEVLEKDLRYLASDQLEGRMTGKEGNILAAKHIKEKFEEFGLQTMYHKFTETDINRRIRGVNPGPKNEMGNNFSQNIYAWIEGNDPKLKNEIVVIGAHMDHIGYGPSMSRSRKMAIHPGADDNASGTVALMEIAKAFSLLKDKVKRTVVFQAYSAEEMGLLGSRFYCEKPIFPRDSPSIQKHIFMLNMDMIGYLGKGHHLAAFRSGGSSIDVSRIIKSLDGKYSFADKITGRSTGGSDHASFYNKRVPIAFLHTGSHRHYHTPRDTADKIDYDGLEKVAKYGFELAWRVVQSDITVTFNDGNFRPMSYVHDHGHPEVTFPRN